MTAKAAVPIRFYECPWLTFDEAISPCDKPLYDWLVSLAPPPPAWTPQHTEEIRLYAGVMQAIVDAHAACEAGKFASHAAPQPGVSLSVATKLPAASAGDGGAREGLRASVSVGFSPPGGCGSIEYQILHRVAGVGANSYPENTKISTQETAPPKNGTGNFANSIVFAAADQTLGWRDVIHKIFTGGVWNIQSNKVFDHYAEWEWLDNPTPGAELQARSEAFSLASMSIALTDFPPQFETGPRWRVLHRYNHQQSNRTFWFMEWMTPLNTQNATWPNSPPPNWGKGYSGNFVFDDFAVEDAWGGTFIDPEGTWTHQSGVVDFAAMGITGQVLYNGDLCEEFLTTFAATGMIDPATTGFVAQDAYFEETVELKTIKQHKACYRVVGIDVVDSVGIRLRVKLINEFAFDACIVARMPFGNNSVYAGKPLSNVTVIVARNLAAKSESAEVAFIVPIYSLDTGAVDYKLSDVIYDAQNGGGIVEHGFACASNAYPDKITITGITSKALALPAATGQTADMWGFFNPAGTRFWSQAGASGQPGTDVVFGYTPSSQSAAGCKLLTITVTIEAFVSVDGVAWTSCNYKYYDTYGVKWYADAVPGVTSINLQLSKYGAWARYGRIITAAAGYARDAGASSSAFLAWSNGDAAELAAYLVSLFDSTLHTWVETRIKMDTGWTYAMAAISGGYSGTPCFVAGRGYAVTADDLGSPADPPESEAALYWHDGGAIMGPDGYVFTGLLPSVSMFISDDQLAANPQMVLT